MSLRLHVEFREGLGNEEAVLADEVGESREDVCGAAAVGLQDFLADALDGCPRL
jgi:hypothetical protein